MPTQFKRQSDLKKISTALNKYEYNDDEMNSFLASPKNEIVGFFNKMKNNQDRKLAITSVEESTMISK